MTFSVLLSLFVKASQIVLRVLVTQVESNK